MVGQEEQPAAEHHRAANLRGVFRENPGETGGTRRPDPELARPAAPVALPVRGLVGDGTGEHEGGRGLDREVVDLAERQLAAHLADRERARVLLRVLPGRGEDQHLARRGPARGPGARIAPVRPPGRLPVRLDARGVYLRPAVAAASPRDLRTVAGEARVADRRRVVGQPPRAAAGHRGQVDVVFGRERKEIAVHMGIPEIRHGSC
jgi:hypothetical protein